MRRRFRRADGLYRRDGFPRLPGTPAHLWPFTRALVATLDLAGLPAALRGGDALDGLVRRDLAALAPYWQAGPGPGAYASDVLGARWGGDRYYDDNAWVGLALVQLERLRPGAGWLTRAVQLFAFAVAGWDRREDRPAPGGVFWVEQGRGIGRRNHDRNTVSNAPNAQLGLHLAELGALAPGGGGADTARRMYDWVNAALDAGAARGAPGDGPFYDKVQGDGSIDRTLWSYNQGSMVGANVLLARARPEDERHLRRAEAIADRALTDLAGGYDRQPAAFHAIWFRNLLILHAATADDGLRRRIREAMLGYADDAWSRRRDRRDLFALSGREVTLLDQSAIVQVLALLAWDPGDYGKLA